MVDTGLIIEGIHVSIEIYKRIKAMGKLPKKLAGLESHIHYIENILLDKKFEEKLKAGNYPRLTEILEEFRDIVSKAFPNLTNKVNPEHKDVFWYAQEFINVKGDEKRCEGLLSDMDSIILRFSNALIMENFNDLNDIKKAIDGITSLSGDSKGCDKFEQSNAKAEEQAVALVIADKQAAEQFYGHVKELHNPDHSLVTGFGNAEAKGYGIAISTSVLGPEAESMVKAVANAGNRSKGKSTGKGKEIKKEKKAEISASSSSNASRPSQAAPTNTAPNSTHFTPTSVDSIALKKVSENEFKIVINYPKLRLSSVQIQELQVLLTGLDGEESYNYIANSSVKDKKSNIVELSFTDEESANILISAINKKITELKWVSLSLAQEGVTPTANQFSR